MCVYVCVCTQISKITSLVDDIQATLDPAIIQVNTALASMTTAQNKMELYVSDLGDYMNAVTDARVRGGGCARVCVHVCACDASFMIIKQHHRLQHVITIRDQDCHISLRAVCSCRRL